MRQGTIPVPGAFKCLWATIAHETRDTNQGKVGMGSEQINHDLNVLYMAGLFAAALPGMIGAWGWGR